MANDWKCDVSVRSGWNYESCRRTFFYFAVALISIRRKLNMENIGIADVVISRILLCL